MEKSIINYHLAKLTKIIDRLFAAVQEKHNVWDNIKLVLLFKNLSLKFDQQQAYILANQNIILKKVVSFLANNKVQIFKNHITNLKIKAITITTRMK